MSRGRLCARIARDGRCLQVVRLDDIGRVVGLIWQHPDGVAMSDLPWQTVFENNEEDPMPEPSASEAVQPLEVKHALNTGDIERIKAALLGAAHNCRFGSDCGLWPEDLAKQLRDAFSLLDSTGEVAG